MMRASNGKNPIAPDQRLVMMNETPRPALAPGRDKTEQAIFSHSLLGHFEEHKNYRFGENSDLRYALKLKQ